MGEGIKMGASGSMREVINYDYDGLSSITYDASVVDGKPVKNFVLKLLTTGKLTINMLKPPIIDVSVIGGGGGGGACNDLASGAGGGGGSGRVRSEYNVDIQKGVGRKSGCRFGIRNVR